MSRLAARTGMVPANPCKEAAAPEPRAPRYDASADYVAGRLRAGGYTVTEQECIFPFDRELSPAVLEQVTPPPTTYETGTYDFSGTNDVTGTLFTTNDVVIPPNPTPPPNSTSGCERGDFTPAPATPAVALIQCGTRGRSSGKARSVAVGPGRSYGQRSGGRSYREQP